MGKDGFLSREEQCTLPPLIPKGRSRLWDRREPAWEGLARPVPASPTHAGSNRGFGAKEAWTQTQVPLLTLCELGPARRVALSARMESESMWLLVGAEDMCGHYGVSVPGTTGEHEQMPTLISQYVAFAALQLPRWRLHLPPHD